MQNTGASKMRTLFILVLTAASLVSVPVHATLYKCQDAAGKTTYTNLQCDKSGLKETRIIPPAPPPAEPAPAKAKPAKADTTSETTSAEKRSSSSERKSGTSLQLIKSQESDEKKCNRLNEQLGKTMDEMDAARRQGYTPKQEAEWNAKLKKLQVDKNKHGCF